MSLYFDKKVSLSHANLTTLLFSNDTKNGRIGSLQGDKLSHGFCRKNNTFHDFFLFIYLYITTVIVLTMNFA